MVVPTVLAITASITALLPTGASAPVVVFLDSFIGNRSCAEGDRPTGTYHMTSGSYGSILADVRKKARVPIKSYFLRLKGTRYCTYFLIAERQNIGDENINRRDGESWR
jgi:hypothetical protein